MRGKEVERYVYKKIYLIIVIIILSSLRLNKMCKQRCGHASFVTTGIGNYGVHAIYARGHGRAAQSSSLSGGTVQKYQWALVYSQTRWHRPQEESQFQLQRAKRELQAQSQYRQCEKVEERRGGQQREEGIVDRTRGEERGKRKEGVGRKNKNRYGCR